MPILRKLLHQAITKNIMKMNRMVILQAFILLLTSGCRNKQEQQFLENRVNVRIVYVSSLAEKLPVHSAGVIMPEEEIKLSFKTGGIIGEIKVKEGEKVRKGDLLASLNLSEIKSQVEIASVAYQKAYRDFVRTRNLHADSVATLEQFQNASSALDVARSNLEIVRFNLDRSKITAPADGIILKQLSRENEMVSPGYPVFLFGISGKNWRLTVGLADRDIVKVNIGDSAVVMPDAWPGVKLPGIVERRGEMAGPLTGTFEAEVKFNDCGYRLASGFMAGVDIFPSDPGDIVTVPAGAVVDANGTEGYLFALTDSSTVRKVKVEIDGIRNEMIALKNFPAGISAIVSEGAAYLEEGTRVNVVK